MILDTVFFSPPIWQQLPHPLMKCPETRHSTLLLKWKYVGVRTKPPKAGFGFHEKAVLTFFRVQKLLSLLAKPEFEMFFLLLPWFFTPLPNWFCFGHPVFFHPKKVRVTNNDGTTRAPASALTLEVIGSKVSGFSKRGPIGKRNRNEREALALRFVRDLVF